METVSMTSIIGMIMTMIISIGLPIVLMIIAWKKLHAKPVNFIIGALTFIVFALILEQILHTVVIKVTGGAVLNNVWLKALYGGLAAGVFEETGRLVSMKRFMKKPLTKENAIMYGIGHGGTEAIIIVGLTAISNIVTSIMINSGSLLKSMEVLDDSIRETAMTQLSALWTTPSYQFYMGGVERIIAIVLHICLSYIVYTAVKNNKIIFYFISISIHFAIDAITVVTAAYLNVAAVEIILAVLVAAIAIFTYHKYRLDITNT